MSAGSFHRYINRIIHMDVKLFGRGFNCKHMYIVHVMECCAKAMQMERTA